MKFIMIVSILLTFTIHPITAIAEENYTWQRIEIRGEDYTAGTYYLAGASYNALTAKCLSPTVSETR